MEIPGVPRQALINGLPFDAGRSRKLTLCLARKRNSAHELRGAQLKIAGVVYAFVVGILAYAVFRAEKGFGCENRGVTWEVFSVEPGFKIQGRNGFQQITEFPMTRLPLRTISKRESNTSRRLKTSLFLDTSSRTSWAVRPVSHNVSTLQVPDRNHGPRKQDQSFERDG